MPKTETESEARSPLPLLPCTCSNLRRAARVVTRLYNRALQSDGIESTPVHAPDGSRPGGRDLSGRVGRDPRARFHQPNENAEAPQRPWVGTGERGRGPANAVFSFNQGWQREVPAIFSPLEASPRAVASCSGRKEHRRTERAPGGDYSAIAGGVIFKISYGCIYIL